MSVQATFKCIDGGCLYNGKLFQELITLFEKLFARNFNLANFSSPLTPGLATQLWSDGCVAWGVYNFQDIAKVWS